jgi:tetratricopeptide (TPR) repeat protein/cold shock CspA family protein
MDIPPNLVKQVEDGKVVLVLGAGASLGAQHPDNISPPLSEDLGKKISDRLLGGEHSNSALGVIAELAINENDLHTVQQFVREVFEPFAPASFHKKLPTFRWHGIATLNFDLILEHAYAKSQTQRLRPILSNRDRIEDHFRTPNDLLYLKLHGCITRVADPDLPLILTPDQYLTHRKGRSRLFEILSSWARERTLVFVGTTLADSDLRTILLNLLADGASRPRYFSVTPTVDPITERFWESKQVTSIETTFEDFLLRLDREITGIARAVSVRTPQLPVFERFSDPVPSLTDSTRQLLENEIEYVHNAVDSPLVDPGNFYRGFSQGWSPIRQNLDCARALTDKLLLETVLNDDPNRAADIVLVHAEAGSGKSVFLRRVAWNAATELDAFCLYANPRSIPTPENMREIAEYTDQRIHVFVDDVADCVPEVELLVLSARKFHIPLTLIVAERSNKWNVTCEDLDALVGTRYRLEYLNNKEIAGLLDLLHVHDAQGTLKGMTRVDQELALRETAGRQLLVALHEATLGRPFEEIIRDEYDGVTPSSAKSIYLTICTLNRNGTHVRAGLISRVHGVTFERFKQEFFAPLEHLVYSQIQNRGHDYEYRARHPYVAELVFRTVLTDANARFQLYSQLLNGLNVAYASDRESFRHLVKSRPLIELFPDPQMVGELYDLAEERVPDDGHVFLQHGIYEMKRPNGNLSRARDLLHRAHELLPENHLVTHSFAELELKIGTEETNPLVRTKHFQAARRLVNDMLSKKAKRSYGYHTGFKIEHARLKDLLLDKTKEVDSDAVAKTIRNAESMIEDGLQLFPGDSYLLSAEAELAESLADDERAIDALERAARANIGNVFVVGRLAKEYCRSGQDAEAMALLEEAVGTNPYDKRLNYLLGKLLIRGDGNGNQTESCFRRAFTEGDRNYDAQFWYARQLYINEKVDEALARFKTLRGERMSRASRFDARGEWRDGDTSRQFAGSLLTIDRGYGWIRRDGAGDVIFVPSEDSTNNALEVMERGQRVRFTIAFNMLGPIAQKSYNQISLMAF